MRKIKIIEHISLDGVVQTSSSPGDDFPYGDWSAPYRSPAGLQLVTEMYGSACDLLLGRRTYDMLASYWPKAQQNPMGDRMAAATKYVVTHHPESLSWDRCEAIDADVVESIRRIKAKPGPDIMVPGSGTVATLLLEHGLADEIILLVSPVVLGKGKRFFADGSLQRSFALGSSRALPTGILANVYKVIPTLAEEALQRAKLEHEMQIARDVQERLFPQTMPTVPGIDVAAQCRPAHAVGGDYYDVICSAGGGRLGIAMGDISGKGVSAALLMASLHASLRSQAMSGIDDLGGRMSNINRLLYEASEANRYATFFYAELDCASRILYYVNGGHNPPAVLRSGIGGPEILRLTEGGPVLGLLPGVLYQQHAIQLLPGDCLLAFTDGLSEAMNPAEQEWGEDRMLAAAEAHSSGSAKDLVKHLFQAADAFAAGAPQHDDMTVLIMRLAS